MPVLNKNYKWGGGKLGIRSEELGIKTKSSMNVIFAHLRHKTPF